jgi:hypothetical protein
MAFRIPDEMPSTDGKYVDCAYRMDIVAEISMAPDIEVHFPVYIMMPQRSPAMYLEQFGAARRGRWGRHSPAAPPSFTRAPRRNVLLEHRAACRFRTTTAEEECSDWDDEGAPG